MAESSQETSRLIDTKGDCHSSVQTTAPCYQYGTQNSEGYYGNADEGEEDEETPGAPIDDRIEYVL